MGIKFNVQWKFKVNGKEYGSLEEMPAEAREAYEKARRNAPSPDTAGTVVVSSTRISFNGEEYPSVDAMPPAKRSFYESVMRAAESGRIELGEEDAAALAKAGLPAPARPAVGPGKPRVTGRTAGFDRLGSNRAGTAPEPAVSVRVVLVVVAVLGLALLAWLVSR